MNSDDFYKIRDLSRSGGYTKTGDTIFVLPSVDHFQLLRIAEDGIDWDRLMNDFVTALLGKLGSFADDWYFSFDRQEGTVFVSQPGILKDDRFDNEFITIQKIVLRKLKLFASHSDVFLTSCWPGFLAHIKTKSFKKKPIQYTTDEVAERARLDGGYGNFQRHVYGKLPYLKFQKESLWERGYFRLDDLIALHRNGKYTLPGKRINFQDLKYVDESEDEGKSEK